MSKPICTVMVGLPGLGKSHLAYGERKIYDAINTSVFTYSTDDYIDNIARMRGLTYSDVFEEAIKEATQVCNQGLDSALAEDLDIIWDQTNLGVGKRRKIINRMEQAGYQIRCMCVLPPKPTQIDGQKEWKYRIANRSGKTIPQNILINMIDSFVEPTIDEGFDMITFYNMYGNILGIDYAE